MLKRAVLTGLVLLAAATGSLLTSSDAHAAPPGQPSNWQRFYYYPYVYYPQNFQQYPESYDHLYYRYPRERQIPVFNANWHNFYLMDKPFHKGGHFALDIF
ncbi:MAG: hypothetical protein DWQ34_23625 [Planctomycetota bacterium]|nr:MAG: hypothetical protein DWQ29_24770 [Planctomycetota bacterium]REJ87930.1 MAG: hypothetical protein DWQ34_23625 [Planctomycetota bacterium]REK23239.1 MAG: hypothetical protein DWQ41_17605 [Planctomycetota bacterium]REK30841.1 MAG: hypothetical protein DWQ45_20585 [Planctomycetota bacterium]